MSQFPPSQPPYSPNPYQGQYPPGGHFGQPMNTGGGDEKTKIPAIALLVLCAISVIVYLGFAAYDVYLITSGQLHQALRNQNAPIDLTTILIIRLVGVAVVMLAHVFIISGAVQMLKKGSFKMAMTAGVLCVIPCFSTPCVVLGIPFGIWTLVVLSDANVKRSFSK